MKSYRMILMSCLVLAGLLMAGCSGEGEVPDIRANVASQTAAAETRVVEEAGATTAEGTPVALAPTGVPATPEPQAGTPMTGTAPGATGTVEAATPGSAVSPMATPAATLSLTDPVPAGFITPDRQFAPQWPVVSAELGWGTGPAQTMDMAWQPFENGEMVWVAEAITATDMISGPTVLVLLGTGEWKAIPDTWTEGQPESDPNLTPPGTLQQPIRGFGRVWRENEEFSNALGWALLEEEGSEGVIQPFENGLMFTVNGITYAAIDRAGERRWRGF